LRALNAQNSARVSDLARATGIPRPSVYRILETLCACGYVRRREDLERYELTIQVRALSDGFKDEDWLRTSAVPVIEALQREIVWPTDLAVFQDNAMYLRETTRRMSPLTIDGAQIGLRLPMLRTATGRAYLAFCGASEQETILENLRKSRLPEDREAKDRRYVETLLAATVRNGYGERQGDLFPKTGAIAIPLRKARRVIACLNVTYIASALSPSDAARKYLPAMRRAGREIESSILSLIP
jgi:IclR family mhp operon transcriptional activator